MTNLDIIKYLATNNPERLAELFADIYCVAWNDGANDEVDLMPDFEKWLSDDSSKFGVQHYDHEVEEWSKAINSTPTITAFYNGLEVTIPADDPDHLWNKDIYNCTYKENNQ